MDVLDVVYAAFLILYFYFMIRTTCCDGNNDEDENKTESEANNQIIIITQDRQGNIYTVSEDRRLNTNPPSFTDFFYLQPGSEEEARIRAQLEKDDKELPTYDEVIRMTASADGSVASVRATPPTESNADAANISFAMTTSTTTTTTTTTTTPVSANILLPPVPPYTEIDINSSIAAGTSLPAFFPITAGDTVTASTSRAAAICKQ